MMALVFNRTADSQVPVYSPSFRTTMRLSAACSIVVDLWLAFRSGIVPTLWAIWKSPRLLFQWHALSRFFMATMWTVYGDGVDENSQSVKQRLITPNAYGVVLDIGAGHGHSARYLDKTRVTRYVALEPNTHMHSKLRKTANAAGFSESDGTLLILPYLAEDISSIVSLIHKHSVDTFISIITLCSIPSAEPAVVSLVSHILKPGGAFLFYEHVLSPHSDVRWWQRFWTPIWTKFFGGCRIDRQTDLWIIGMPYESGSNQSMWSDADVRRKEGEPEDFLFYHRIGKMVKRSAQGRLPN